MPVVSVEAPVEHVTVYASGAHVRRVTTIPAPLPDRVRIVGLPIAVIDDTVRVEVGGPALATAVRVGVEAPAASEAAAEEPAELAEARSRAAHATAAVARLEAALEALASVAVVEPVATDGTPVELGAVLAARRALVALHGEREHALREELVTAQREVLAASRALDAALDRERRTGSARAAKLHELRKYIELDLVATAASEIVVHVEYLVAAARWAPSYVARIEGDRVRFEIRAVVAQEAGENWTAVPLSLSTAEPARFTLLPELAAQKIGRRQDAPSKTGFRPPPTGAASLYADYDRARGPRRSPTVDARQFTGGSRLEDSTYVGVRPGGPPAATVIAHAPAAFASEVWDEESSRGKEAFSTPAAGSAKLDLSAPSPQRLAFSDKKALQNEEPAPVAEQARRSRPRGEGGVGGVVVGGVLPAAPRLDYGNLVMPPPSSPDRGALGPAQPDRHASAIASELTAVLARLTTLSLPPGCVADWSHTYDYAFATDGAVDVAADGAWHSIAVTAKTGSVTLAHVAVPREQADVFRLAELANPFAGPLLPGPIDVYDRGRFLITSEVDYTPPGAAVRVGLGVDPSVKIARNTEYREETTGMLRGALRLHHAITIVIENLSPRAVELEVRERIPVAREGDDEIEVIAQKVDPPWERWTPDPGAPRERRLRGGHRWKVSVPAGAKRTLRAGYEVKIAGKHELVGGNRRES